MRDMSEWGWPCDLHKRLSEVPACLLPTTYIFLLHRKKNVSWSNSIVFFFFWRDDCMQISEQNHPYFKVTPSPLSSDHLLHYLKPQHLLTVHISLATILEAVASSQRKRQDVFSTVRSWLPSLEYLISPRRRLPARLCSLLCERPACTTQHILASWQGHYITNGQ